MENFKHTKNGRNEPITPFGTRSQAFWLLMCDCYKSRWKSESKQNKTKVTSWKYEGDENKLLEAVNGRCHNVFLELWQDLKW